MDIVALVVSIVSLIASSCISIVAVYMAKKINNINLESALIKDIVDDYLKEKIPEAFYEINYAENKLSGIDNMQRAIAQLKMKMRFIKFTDEPYYRDFKALCDKLEDFIVSNEGKDCLVDDQSKTTQTISDYITDIYKHIYKKYKG